MPFGEDDIRVPLPEEKGYTYGSVLPLRRRDTLDVDEMDIDAEPEWAVPGILRDPVNAVARLSQRAKGERGIDPGETFMDTLDAGMGMAALGRAPAGATLGMNVWQGGPHKYGPEGAAKSLQHIGKGEGATAYGWGRYDAGNPDVADEYRKRLSTFDSYGSKRPSVAMVDDVPARQMGQDVWEVADALASRKINIDEYIEELLSKISQSKNPERVAVYQDMINKAKSVKPVISGKNIKFDEGNLYKHDLPDEDIARYLDWDKPLSEQPESVRAAMQKAFEEAGIPDAMNMAPDGQSAYAWLSSALARGESVPDAVLKQRASEALGRAGIPGLQYYDGMSRNAGEGTRNYVTWDQDVLDRMKLLERNGEKFASDMSGAGAAGIAAQTTGEDNKMAEPKRTWGQDDLRVTAEPMSAPTPEAETPWHSFATGAGRTEFEDAPELGTSGDDVPTFSKEGMRMLGAYGLSTDPKQIQDIAVKTLPGAAAKSDKFGNEMVTFNGKDYYVNKPGVSEADIFQLVSQAVAYAPASKWAAAAKKTSNRIWRAMFGAGGTSALTDAASGGLGSDQGIDPLKAGITAAGGMLFEGLSPLAVKAWRGIFSRNSLFDEATGTLTDAGRKAAIEGGLDPDTMTSRLAREFADEARDAVDPRAAAGRSSGKEFDIPYTKGQSTGDIEQLAREEATRNGAFGEKAGGIVRDFDDIQNVRMQAGRDQIQSTIAQGERQIARPGQAGEAVTDGIQARAERLRGQIDKAYEATREVDARLNSESLKGATRRIVASVKDDFDLDKDLTPRAMKAIKNIASLERRVANQNKSGRITAVSFREIERQRRRINNLLNGAEGSDRAALTRIKGELDNWIDDAFDNALYSGDENALRLMKEARSLRAKYGEMFEPKNPQDVAGKVIAKIVSDENMSPDNVINNVLGRSGLGQKEASVAILKKIKNIVGEDSPDWLAMKEAAWLRLAKDVGTDQFSPKKFANSLNKVMETNRSVINELFSPDEVAMMHRFRDDVLRTVTPDNARNPSKTSYNNSRLIREWLGRLGTMFTFGGNPAGGALFFTLKRAPEVMGTRGAKAAVRGAGPAVPKAPNLVAPLTGEAALQSERLPRPTR